MTPKGSSRQHIAAFGFRSIPPTAGCAGADKFASELLPRLVARGYVVTAYNRLYPGQHPGPGAYQGVRLKYFSTTHAKGFDTLLHSAKATYDIIRHRTGDIVHIQNGGNSIFGLVLRMFGRKVFVSQDGVDWKRDKWPFYGKLYLRFSALVTAFGPTKVVFDNVFARKLFEGWFPWARNRFEYIPFGSEPSGNADSSSDILAKLGLDPKSYFLFVGRFIPDKGIQYLIPAYERVKTDKKLVLVGGSPNPSAFEDKLRATQDPRILFPGFLYGPDVSTLMVNAFAYVQPSDIEGLSPVILENMGIGTPVICSDIEENLFVVGDTATTFRRGDVEDLRLTLTRAIEEEPQLQDRARRAKERALSLFSWSGVVDSHIRLFNEAMG